MLRLVCFLSCLRKSVSVVITGTVHGGKLGIFLGVAKMTLVLRSCSYWENSIIEWECGFLHWVCGGSCVLLKSV